MSKSKRSYVNPTIYNTTSSTMPNTDLAAPNGGTWSLRNAQDFNIPISLGGIYSATSGDLGMLNPASAAFAAGYGTGPGAWKIKQALSPDTDAHAKYHGLKTMSIANSILTIHNYVDGTDGPLGSAIKPLNQSDLDTNYFTYGRFATRWRAVANPTTGGPVTGTHWGAVSFAIPDDAHFPEWSEMDWLETSFPNTNPGGFWHPGGDAVNNSIAKAGTGVGPISEWHTPVIEWSPDPAGALMSWYDGGALAFRTTLDTPISPAKLGWLLQTASSGGVPTGDAYVQMDWFVQWDYVP